MKKSLLIIVFITSLINSNIFAQEIVAINMTTVPKELRSFIKIPNSNAYNNLPAGVNLYSSSDSKEAKSINEYFNQLIIGLENTNTIITPHLKEAEALLKKGKSTETFKKIENLINNSSTEMEFLKSLAKEVEITSNIEEKTKLQLYLYSVQILSGEIKKLSSSKPELMALSFGWKCAFSVIGGTLTGGLSGVAIGAAGGSVIPGFGTAVGAVVGGAVGAIGGGLSGAASGC